MGEGKLGPLSELHVVLRTVVKTVFDEAAAHRKKDAVELIRVERLHPGTGMY